MCQCLYKNLELIRCNIFSPVKCTARSSPISSPLPPNNHNNANGNVNNIEETTKASIEKASTISDVPNKTKSMESAVQSGNKKLEMSHFRVSC